MSVNDEGKLMVWQHRSPAASNSTSSGSSIIRTKSNSYLGNSTRSVDNDLNGGNDVTKTDVAIKMVTAVELFLDLY